MSSIQNESIFLQKFLHTKIEQKFTFHYLQKVILEDNFSLKNQKLQSKSQPRLSQKLTKIQYFSNQFLFHFSQEFFQKWKV